MRTIRITLWLMKTASDSDQPHDDDDDMRRTGDAAGTNRSATATGAVRSPVARLSSRQLLGAAAEVEIEHAGAVYRLRRTSLGKLILTK